MLFRHCHQRSSSRKSDFWNLWWYCAKNGRELSRTLHGRNGHWCNNGKIVTLQTLRRPFLQLIQARKHSANFRQLWLNQKDLQFFFEKKRKSLKKVPSSLLFSLPNKCDVPVFSSSISDIFYFSYSKKIFWWKIDKFNIECFQFWTFNYFLIKSFGGHSNATFITSNPTISTSAFNISLAFGKVRPKSPWTNSWKWNWIKTSNNCVSGY